LRLLSRVTESNVADQRHAASRTESILTGNHDFNREKRA
jgi:hypothetical protein